MVLRSIAHTLVSVIGGSTLLMLAVMSSRVMHRLTFLACFASPVLLVTSSAVAGMPSVLPEDLTTILRLNASPYARLQAISFFLLGIGLSAWAVRALWNYLARDFSRLPRLTYSKALALVVLCGLLFVVVLTMISGARELMTPAAWKKQGLTYTLQEDPVGAESARPPDANPASGSSDHPLAGTGGAP